MPSLLVGSQFSFHNGFWLDRQLVGFCSELAADINATDRCTPHVALSSAIVQGMENRLPSQETVQCWLKSEAELRAAFDACPEHWQCMREAWRLYVKGKDCLFCKELPTNKYHLLMDEEHLSRHVPSMQNRDLPNSTSRSHRTGLQPDAHHYGVHIASRSKMARIRTLPGEQIGIQDHHVRRARVAHHTPLSLSQRTQKVAYAANVL